MSPQYGELRSTKAVIGSGVWASQQISTGFASCLRYCTDVAHRRPTKLQDVWPSPRLVHYIYIFGGSYPLTFCPVQNSLYVQLSHFPILEALLHGTAAAGVSQALQHGTRNGITELSHLYLSGRPSHSSIIFVFVFLAIQILRITSVVN